MLKNLSIDSLGWLEHELSSLTDILTTRLPSEWAEEVRYLPDSLSERPGYFRFDVAPMFREILDCLHPSSPIREIALQKGVQTGYTVAVLENAIGYGMDELRSAPMMLVSAEDGLARDRMDINVQQMLDHSDLYGLIAPSDPTNTRKTGNTARKVEFSGGGFLIPCGAKNAARARSTSVKIFLGDEIDGWPEIVGKDGDPLALFIDRTASFESSRKIFLGSTPLLAHNSKINKAFRRGDQRYFYMPCLGCGDMQPLKWQKINKDTGEITGIVWEREGNTIVPGSVRYRCPACSHEHINADKIRMFPRGEWRPTSGPVSPSVRSYHLNALYAPFQSWEAQVLKWIEAWDIENDCVRDVGKLQAFYNNVLGKTFEDPGQRLEKSAVSIHRRKTYRRGSVPNEFASKWCGSPILAVTAVVDVHDHDLSIAVWGWAAGKRMFLIDYEILKGNTKYLDDPGTWQALDKILTTRDYIADDGKKYVISLTMIDSGDGDRHAQVYKFCGSFAGGVIPLKGVKHTLRKSNVKEFGALKSSMGVVGVGVTVDLYKEQVVTVLSRPWLGGSLQPEGHFNAPKDITEKELAQLTAEKKVELKDSRGEIKGYEWHRSPGVDNTLFDLMVYGMASIDILAYKLCIDYLELKTIEWPQFWALAEEKKIYFSE